MNEDLTMSTNRCADFSGQELVAAVAAGIKKDHPEKSDKDLETVAVSELASGFFLGAVIKELQAPKRHAAPTCSDKVDVSLDRAP